MKAFFYYDPQYDRQLPSSSIGLAFVKGDILEVFNVNDDQFWQVFVYTQWLHNISHSSFSLNMLPILWRRRFHEVVFSNKNFVESWHEKIDVDFKIKRVMMVCFTWTAIVDAAL